MSNFIHFYKLKTSLAVAIILFIITAFKPVHLETVKFVVSGNCEMCKARIEKALQQEGVVKANWDVNSKTLELTYNPHMISVESAHQWIAAAGHDTEKIKASDEAYKNLAKCCQYRKDSEPEKKKKKN